MDAAFSATTLSLSLCSVASNVQKAIPNTRRTRTRTRAHAREKIALRLRDRKEECVGAPNGRRTVVIGHWHCRRLGPSEVSVRTRLERDKWRTVAVVDAVTSPLLAANTAQIRSRNVCGWTPSPSLRHPRLDQTPGPARKI